KTDFDIWRHHQPCKHHRGNGARCTQAPVMRIVFVPEISGQQGDHQGQQVQGQVEQFARLPEYVDKLSFHKSPEQIKGDHIKCEVRDISMNKTATDEPVILSLISNRRRVKDKIIHYLLIAEGGERDDSSND